MTRKQIGIVTVHGTGDTAGGPDGDKWFQNGSEFIGRLKARLAAHGFDAEVLPFLWSGANSARAREQGAQKLAKAIRRHARKHGPVHVIGHSHGGNVANEAARILRWRPKANVLSLLLSPLRFLIGRKERIASLTTVGTPFFRSRLSAAESFGGAAFLLLLIVSTMVLAMVGLALLYQLALPMPQEPPARIEDFVSSVDQLTPEERQRRSLSGVDQLTPAERDELANEYMARVAHYDSAQNDRRIALTIFAIYPFFVVPLIFIYPIAFSGLARILRLRRKRNEAAQVHSIWHPNDEAIAFLQRIEKLPIEPFPRGSLWRGSRTAGIVWGVRVTIWMFAIGLIMLFGGMFGLKFPDAIHQWLTAQTASLLGIEVSEGFSESLVTTLGAMLSIVAVVGMPIIFGVVYLLTRLLIYGAALEVGLRGALNKSIGGVLKGIAFGRDGDEDVGDVATESHCHGAHCVTLKGEVADRMQKASAVAADALIAKYRWALFTVGGDSNEALQALATDAMTWDSLIHTTYFDQPEVVDMIGDYIVGQEQRVEEKAREPLFKAPPDAQPAPA